MQRPKTSTASAAEMKAWAEHLLNQGFTTKSGQKDALDAVSSAFEKVNRRLSTYILSKDDREGTEYDKAYWEKPSYPHQYKDTKHGEWYDWIDSRQLVNELKDLRDKIKAAEVTKVASKKEVNAKEIAKSEKFGGGDKIREAIEPMKQDAIQRATDEAQKVIKRVKKLLQDNDMNATKAAPYPKMGTRDPEYGKYLLVRKITKADRSTYGKDEFRQFSQEAEARFIEESREAAALEYEGFVLKMIEKITKFGNISSATIDGNHVWGYSHLTVELESGETQVWRTQMIINVSKLGKLFNQFPSRKVKN